jgi:hypothetical protein
MFDHLILSYLILENEIRVMNIFIMTILSIYNLFVSQTFIEKCASLIGFIPILSIIILHFFDF